MQRQLVIRTLPPSGPQKNYRTESNDMIHEKYIFFGRIKSKNTLRSYIHIGEKKQNRLRQGTQSLWMYLLLQKCIENST